MAPGVRPPSCRRCRLSLEFLFGLAPEVKADNAEVRLAMLVVMIVDSQKASHLCHHSRHLPFPLPRDCVGEACGKSLGPKFAGVGIIADGGRVCPKLRSQCPRSGFSTQNLDGLNAPSRNLSGPACRHMFLTCRNAEDAWVFFGKFGTEYMLDTQTSKIFII